MDVVFLCYAANSQAQTLQHTMKIITLQTITLVTTKIRLELVIPLQLLMVLQMLYYEGPEPLHHFMAMIVVVEN